MQASPYHFTTPVAQIFNVTSFKKFCEKPNYTFDPVQDICIEWFVLYVDDIHQTTPLCAPNIVYIQIENQFYQVTFRNLQFCIFGVIVQLKIEFLKH